MLKTIGIIHNAFPGRPRDGGLFTSNLQTTFENTVAKIEIAHNLNYSCRSTSVYFEKKVLIQTFDILTEYRM